MSEKGITHDTASRLLGVTPYELEKLVGNGFVRRNDKNSYSIPVLVQDYIGHIKKESKKETYTQSEIAAHLDLSDRSIRELQTKLNLSSNYTLDEIRIAYIRNLREQAAGRASADGELDLVQERAGLAREQRISMELKNAITRKEYAPVELIATVLATASQTITDELNALPSTLKKISNNLPDEVITAIDEACRKARTNWVHAVTMPNLEPTDIEQSDTDTFEEEGADA